MPRRQHSRPFGPTLRSRTEHLLDAQSFYDLHRTWAWVVIIGNGLAGSWALGAHLLPALRTRALWWFTGAAELAIVVQAVLGVVLVDRYAFELDSFHALYGFSAIIAAAIVYSYRAQMKHRLYLLYGGGGLFIMGLGIRAMFLGGAN